MLVINAGNNFNYNSPILDIDAQYIVRGLNLTKVDFIGLGAWDLACGIEKIKKLARKSVAGIVCANVDGFLPYVRITRGGKKILITSILDPDLLDLYKVKDIAIKDPSSTLRKLEREIKHDFFIVVTHARGERNLEILSGCTGIDLIIDGEQPRQIKKKELLLGATVVGNNLGGKYVAYVDICNDKKASRQIGLPKMIRVATNTVAIDPEIAGLLSQYEEERRQYLKKQREIREKRALQKRRAGNLYLGSGWCGSCHGAIEEAWKQTKHAKAIESLTGKRRDDDPECLKCHVTGLNDKHAVGGFVSISASSKMVGVQCETCHGPGGRHAAAPLQSKMRTVDEKTCRFCHNNDTDPTFNFGEDLEKIDHGKMPGK